MKTLLFLLVSMVVGASAQNRGLWFWGNTTLPDGSPSAWGANQVVGVSWKENNSLNWFAHYGVTKVYGSYGTRPVTDAGVIAAWNTKLHNRGIESQLLISGSTVHTPAGKASILAKVQARLIDFNAGQATAAAKFKALHLDLEPQQLPEWDTPVDKRGLLDDLLGTYDDIRQLLDAEGMTGFPIYADIHFGWDKLPVDGGSIAWVDAADRDDWYETAEQYLAGFTVMTFSKDSSASLQAATLYERTFPLGPAARVGIKAKLGEPWDDYAEYATTLAQLETDIGTTEATDIENYALWRHLAPAVPLQEATIYHEIAVNPSGGGGTIVFEADVGAKYYIHQTDGLDGKWQVVQEIDMTGARHMQMVNHAFDTSAPSGFFKIEMRPASQQR